MELRAGTVLSIALLATGCASLPSAPGYSRPGVLLGDRPPVVGAPSMAQGPGGGRSRAPASALRNSAVGGTQQDAARTRQALLDAVHDVRGSLANAASGLSGLAARTTGIGGANGVFSRYVTYGSGQLPWLEGSLVSSRARVDATVGIGDAEMEVAVLRLGGPQLQASMSGGILLAAWVDFLSLADAVLQRCPSYSPERLFMDMNRVQRLIEPSMAALASQDPAQVEAAAIALPGLMAQLTDEFASIREGARVAAEHSGRAIMVAQLVEMVTMMSAMRMLLPRFMPPPPAVPVTLGATLVVGSNGVMAGSQIVLSAEWVEMIRRLVQAGVISLPAVSATVRIQAGQVMMAQANGDLPRGVREALGDGPEVRGMHETGKAGAGMAEAPRHHVLPQEHRAWFEQRGFKGAMDIDQFCVRLERAEHEAIHGGGSWRLGRTWPDEWSRMIMGVLQDAEALEGRMLTPAEILQKVAGQMRRFRIPMRFIPGRTG